MSVEGFENYRVELLFEMDGHWGIQHKEWSRIVSNSATQQTFVGHWATACTLEQNRALVPLLRRVGVLATAGESKQLRFTLREDSEGFRRIVACPCRGTWTPAELLDLKAAFILVAPPHIEALVGHAVEVRGRLTVE
jgi:hypothetical protein